MLAAVAQRSHANSPGGGVANGLQGRHLRLGGGIAQIIDDGFMDLMRGACQEGQ